MSAVKATEVARGRWQLDQPIHVNPCGCRVLTDGDPEYPEEVRPVATCPTHSGYDRRPLIPWAPV